MVSQRFPEIVDSVRLPHGANVIINRAHCGGSVLVLDQFNGSQRGAPSPEKQSGESIPAKRFDSPPDPKEVLTNNITNSASNSNKLKSCSEGLCGIIEI